MPEESYAEKTARVLTQEIVTDDAYRLKFWQAGFFDTIIDIGANVGFFVEYAAQRNPEANIFACEPGREAYLLLKEKYEMMPNVVVANVALGDGHDLFYYCPSTNLTLAVFYKAEEKSRSKTGSSVKSFSLRDMLQEYGVVIGNNYYIKIDCEGGERFLLHDAEAVSIIKGANGVGMEIHAKTPKSGPKRVRDRLGNFPPMADYVSWVNDNFSDTHEIIFHSAYPNIGTVMCIMCSKDRVGRV